MNYDEVWKSAVEAKKSGRTRGFPIGDGSQILAMVDSAGNRSFVVRCGANSVAVEWKSHTVHVEKLEMTVEGDRGEYVKVACLDVLGHRLFDQFIHDLDACGEPLDALGPKLREYRAFWTTPLVQFTSNRAVGLFGELFFLNTWLEPRRDIHSWTGYNRTLRDFSWEHLSVEVKATRGEVPIHRISSIGQLNPQEGKKLWLFSLIVRQDPEGGHSLRGVVEAIKAKLDDPEKSEAFQIGIAEAGFRPDLPGLDEYRYILLQQTLYEVREGFPRCVPESFVGGGVPNGVSAISYAVDLCGCSGFDTGLTSPLDEGVLYPNGGV